MPKNYDDFLSLKKSAELPLVMAIAGEERGLVREAIAFIREKVQNEPRDFNHDRLDAKNCESGQIVMSAKTLPVMAKTRLVEVQSVDKLESGDVDLLKQYLDAPQDTTVLVLIFDSNPSLKQKFASFLDKNGWLFDFTRPKEYEMPKIIARRAKARGLILPHDAVEAIALVVGNNLSLLENAFDKLEIVTSSGKAVSVSDIGDHISNSKLQDAFELGRAVATGNKKKALISLCKLKMAREVPLRLLGMLAWQLRLVLRARIMLDDGFNDREIERKLSLYGNNKGAILFGARKWPASAHSQRLVRLSTLDQELKQSPVPAWFWLERIVMQLCLH